MTKRVMGDRRLRPPRKQGRRRKAHQRISSIACALLSSGAIGCGGTAPSAAPSAPLLCDPDRTGEIALGYQFLGEVDQVLQGEAVLVENGFEFLFIDGACNFWSFNAFSRPAGPFASPRHGQISADMLAELNSSAMELPWADIAGERSLASGLDHPGLAVVWRDDGAAACFYPCESASSTLRSIVDWVRPFNDRLFANTPPASSADTTSADTTAVRYVAISWDPLDGFPTTEWEGMTPLSDLAVSPMEYFETYHQYGGHPTATGIDADELRRIREPYRTGALDDFSYHFLPVTDDGGQYLVWTRDSLPFEDDSGLVRPPGGLD